MIDTLLYFEWSRPWHTILKYHLEVIHIYIYILTLYLTFFLAYTLTFYLTFWHSLWHVFGSTYGPPDELAEVRTSSRRRGWRKEGGKELHLAGGKKTTSNIIIILGCSPWTKHLNAVKLIFLHGPPCQILPAPADSHRQWCGEPWGSRGSRGCRGLFSGSSQDVVI